MLQGRCREGSETARKILAHCREMSMRAILTSPPGLQKKPAAALVGRPRKTGQLQLEGLNRHEGDFLRKGVLGKNSRANGGTTWKN